MSEQTDANAYLQTEDSLKETLSGGLLINALDFVAYLKDSGRTCLPKAFAANFELVRHPEFYYMGELSCLICDETKNENNPFGWWQICCWQCECDIYELDSFPVDESLKEFTRNNVKKCFGCGGCDAPGGSRRTVFGIEYDGVCCNIFHFQNPDGAILENIKKLMELQKHIIAASRTR